VEAQLEVARRSRVAVAHARSQPGRDEPQGGTQGQQRQRTEGSTHQGPIRSFFEVKRTAPLKALALLGKMPRDGAVPSNKERGGR
jgi:hypothetical protein